MEKNSVAPDSQNGSTSLSSLPSPPWGLTPDLWAKSPRWPLHPFGFGLPSFLQMILTVLGTGSTVMNKTGQSPCLHGVSIPIKEKSIGREVNT